MASEDLFIPPVLSSDQTADENFNIVETTAHHIRTFLGPELESCRDSTVIYNELIEYYNLQTIFEHISKRNYKKITLQFPDHLVMDSSYVIKYFQETDETDRDYFILADTSYSFCCVDEVAAEHVKGDIVVHFGDACFTQVSKLPIVYSLGNPYLNIEKLVEAFSEQIVNPTESVVLMADSPFNNTLLAVNQALKSKGFSNILLLGINYEAVENEEVSIFPANKITEDKITEFSIGSNRSIYNINNIELNFDISESYLQNSTLFHITEPTTSTLMQLSTVFNNIIVYDPVDGRCQKPVTSLMKRYKEMHKARTATTFGILVNTLSIKNTKDTVNKITKLLKTNYKKSHIFIVGKPNVAKLANFESIDIWVCVGCPQSGIIIDMFNEFYKPIVTPFELTLAMEKEVSWTGKWILDNGKILDIIDEKIGEAEEDIQQNSDFDEDEPVFDAVKGVYVSNSKPLRDLHRVEVSYENDSNADESKHLVKNMSKNLVLKDTYSTAAESLLRREWKGLGSNFAKGDNESEDSDFEEEGASVKKGISGVARSYKFDEENKVKGNNQKLKN